ncbi:sulfatase family protein [Kriegella aquimaris]|uniref:Arylsulfatase A n=1 Tax=Kriegella aquimaris TaxID=192904 RepID=A0A1G9SN74_9FLAO|nr:sulfatase [Kriegella aquimaris]SDM36872.1 Arylsulfatase A [Kriegella aquimaris]
MIKLRIVPFLCLALTILGCKEAEKEKIAERPNVLFAIMDDATYMHMSAYGCSWVDTPNFDRVATNGLLFNKAYTANAKCAPSRSNILTGRNSWQLEEAANHWPVFPTKFKVFTETLAENGYTVGYTGKGWAPGIAKHKDGSKRELLIKAFSQIKTTPPTPKISNVDYAANFDAFLQQKEDKPFFFWYGGLEPHRAYEYGSGIAKGGKSLSEISDADVYDFWPAVDSVKTDLLDYAFEIEYFDQQLGKMLQNLEDRGELSNTLIVVTSDNGMPFPRIKGQEYEYSNHLPLAMMWADGIQKPGRKIDDFISFIDFAPTFLEVAGVPEAKNDMQPITGHSFTDILYSEKEGFVKPERDFVLIGKERHDVGRPHDQGYPIRGIVCDSMLYLQNFETDRWPVGNPERGYPNTDGSPTKTLLLHNVYAENDDFNYWKWSFGKRPSQELYNILRDPDCMHNLALQENHQTVLAELHQQLFDALSEQEDPRMAGAGAIFDNYKYANKGGVNFYERYGKGEELQWGWINDSDFQDLSKVKRVQDSLEP